MTSELRIGCIGAGISGTAQMLNFERFEPGCCVAFSDLTRENFDRRMEKLFGRREEEAVHFRADATGVRPEFRDLPYYEDPEEMLAKEDINTVIIATYCSAHCEMVRKCVKHGVQILLEKPIATTEEDVEEIWRLLKDYPHLTYVNFTLRGAPAYLAARRHVRGGDIGDVMSVQYVNNVHYGDQYYRQWRRTRARIGSPLLEKAVHDFDVINTVINRTPRRVSAFGSMLYYGGDMPNDLTCDQCPKEMDCPMSVRNRRLLANRPFPPDYKSGCVFAEEIDINDNYVVNIEYEGGVTASYNQIFHVPVDADRRGGNFIGTEGLMAMEFNGDVDISPAGVISGGRSHIRLWRYTDRPLSNVFEEYDWGKAGHFGSDIGRAKYEMLKGRRSEAPATIRDGYVAAKMAIAAQKSVESGRVVEIDLAE